MTKVIFQKREETENSRLYPNLMPPWVEKFRGEVHYLEIGVERMRYLVLQKCEEDDMDFSGEWRILAYFNSGPKVMYLGDVY